MKTTSANELLYDDNLRVMQQSKKQKKFCKENAGETSLITNYEVFPGICLLYNEFHTEKCPRHSFLHKEILEINYCHEGRFECEFINGRYTYLSPGDLAVHTIVNSQTVKATFPLEHYRGITIFIDLKTAEAIFPVLTDISIDLYAVREHLCSDDRCFIIRTRNFIRQIFSELYAIPDEVKSGYIKLKVLELLLLLNGIDASEQFEKRSYFPVSQVNKIKYIKQFLIQHMERHFPLKVLSERFDIAITALNAGFKAVYGMPVYGFLRTYRMQAAATMLRTSKDSITVIAGKVGYDNSSKFSSAFRSVMKRSPSEYRKYN